MCLVTDQLKPIILKKDLTVYKLLRKSFISNNMVSPYYHFVWELGILYKNPGIKFVSHENSNLFDDIAREWVENKIGMCYDLVEDNDEIISIGEGFHAALTKERLSKLLINNKKLYECTYPKGSIIYSDPTGLCVSNQIIINKCIEYYN